tara:strand:+ start:265 stop:474 length:210 start_codon:yes stop_codon:yes gene_type:complete
LPKDVFLIDLIKKNKKRNICGIISEISRFYGVFGKKWTRATSTKMKKPFFLNKNIDFDHEKMNKKILYL